MTTPVKINYDTAFGEDDEMSQSDIHNALILYLMNLLTRLFAGQEVGIFTSIQLYGDPLHPGQYKSPDILVIDNCVSEPDQEITSYYIDSEHVAPRVLIEINSEGNWLNDLEEKHDVYQRMGVPEYFVCDPHIERYWTGIWYNEPRLLGWRLQNGSYVRISSEDGRLWSEQLDSYLVMEGYGGRQLHLYDVAGNLRLTGDELAAQLLLERNNEAQRAAQLEIERDAEHSRAQKLEEMLRKLNPNFKEEDLN